LFLDPIDWWNELGDLGRRLTVANAPERRRNRLDADGVYRAAAGAYARRLDVSGGSRMLRLSPRAVGSPRGCRLQKSAERPIGAVRLRKHRSKNARDAKE